MTVDGAILKRRNGRPQACDPCRQRKVSCDNAQPVCSRCRRRKNANCVYTISSHTVASEQPAYLNTQSVAQRRRATSARPPSSASSTPAPLMSPDAPSDSASSMNLAAPALSHTGSGSQPSVLSPTPAPRQGYLGFTSYSNVFKETSNRLSRLQGGRAVPVPVVPQPQPIAQHQASPAARSFETILSPITRQMGITLLRVLPELHSACLDPGPSTSRWDGWVRVLSRRILETLQTTWSGYCIRGIDDSKLDEMARKLNANTSKPVSEAASDIDGYLEQFTGENLRWESLGMLLTFRELYNRDTTWGLGSIVMYTGVCVELTKQFTDGNLLQLYVSFRWMIMESNIGVGDAGLATWRAHAETVSLLTFMGLHADCDYQHYTPTFVSELRRRLFAYVFNIDKVCASFQGRPPLLSHVYVSSRLPLDITDEAFTGGPDALTAALAEVDEKGWNTAGHLSSATQIRARTMLAYVKDELMSMALSQKETPSVEKILYTKSRAISIFDEVPTVIKYRCNDIENYDLEVEVMFARHLVRVEYLQTLFFAERLLQRHGDPQRPNDGELLLISFDLVVMVLGLWVNKDRFYAIIQELEWLIMGYAAPGGGILCNELLRPTFDGPHHPRNPKITRSAIIQQLSLLVSFLGWVSPDAPNSELCASCRVVIQHVLDHTLNGGVVIQQQEEVQEQQTLGDMVGCASDMDMFFNFDLLDTYGWMRDDMVDMSL